MLFIMEAMTKAFKEGEAHYGTAGHQWWEVNFIAVGVHL